MRILLIEDDTSVADFIVRGFREAGHTIDHAADGARRVSAVRW